MMLSTRRRVFLRGTTGEYDDGLLCLGRVRTVLYDEPGAAADGLRYPLQLTLCHLFYIYAYLVLYPILICGGWPTSTRG